MVRFKDAVAVAGVVCESATCTVKLAVPVAVGVPEISPEVERVSPTGRLPETTDQVYGGTPPEAASEALYGTLTEPEVNEDVVIDRALLTTMDLLAMSTAAVGVCESVTWTLKLEVPNAVGVPLITPAALMLSPGGSVPDASDQVKGCRPPVAVKVAE